METSPERAVVGSRLTAYEPFGSLRAVSVSCRYSVIRICVAEVEAASCWGLSTKPPMGYGHPKCRSPAGRMYDGESTRRSVQVESSSLLSRRTASARKRPGDADLQGACCSRQELCFIHLLTFMISNEAVKTIVFAVCCLPLRP